MSSATATAKPIQSDPQTTESTEQPVTHKSFHGGFQALNEEYSYWCDDIEGDLPKDFSGTFFRNGPGRMEIGGERFGHWFDGDGMVCAITFKNGQVHFKNRYVRTPKYIKETEQQRIAYRGFGTQRPGGWWKNAMRGPAHVANTSVMYHGGKLLALWEGGAPYELNPATLETRGEYSYQGHLNQQNPFSAHGKVNHKTGYYYNFGMGMMGMGWKGPNWCVNLYKVSPNGQLVDTARFPVNDFTFLHDFAITEHFAVIIISSVKMEGAKEMVFGTGSLASTIRFDHEQPAQVLVVDLKTMKLAERYEIDPMLVVHYANAFERNGELLVDLIRFTDFEDNNALSNVFEMDSLGGGDLHRFTINIPNARIKHERLSDNTLPSEFPTIDARFTGFENRYTFLGTMTDNGTPGFFNAIHKFDNQTGKITPHQFGPGRFTSEPIFMPKHPEAKEGEGYVSSVVYNADEHKSYVVVLDASNMEEIARVNLKHHVPHQFHGQFSPHTFV